MEDSHTVHCSIMSPRLLEWCGAQRGMLQILKRGTEPGKGGKERARDKRQEAEEWSGFVQRGCGKWFNNNTHTHAQRKSVRIWGLRSRNKLTQQGRWALSNNTMAFWPPFVRSRTEALPPQVSAHAHTHRDPNESVSLSLQFPAGVLC